MMNASPFLTLSLAIHHHPKERTSGFHARCKIIIMMMIRMVIVVVIL